MIRPPPIFPLFPYPTLSRSGGLRGALRVLVAAGATWHVQRVVVDPRARGAGVARELLAAVERRRPPAPADRKSTRLNSSHMSISYAVFCFKKKKKTRHIMTD